MMSDRLDVFEPLSVVLARTLDLIEREMVRHNPSSAQWPEDFRSRRLETEALRESVK